MNKFGNASGMDFSLINLTQHGDKMATKNIGVIIGLFLFVGCAGIPQTTASEFVFERIVNVEMNKKDIISNSVAFIAEKFVSAKSVIQLKDPELGKIVGDVVLMNSKARFLDAFHGIKTRLVLDAKDGKYRLQMRHVVATDKNGIESEWGKIEGANRYRIEPMAKSILAEFSDELTAYLKKAKASENW